MTTDYDPREKDHFYTAGILVTRQNPDITVVAQVHATLAVAQEVSQLRAALTDIQASLSMICDALGSIERTIGPPDRT